MPAHMRAYESYGICRHSLPKNLPRETRLPSGDPESVGGSLVRLSLAKWISDVAFKLPVVIDGVVESTIDQFLAGLLLPKFTRSSKRNAATTLNATTVPPKEKDDPENPSGGLTQILLLSSPRASGVAETPVLTKQFSCSPHDCTPRTCLHFSEGSACHYERGPAPKMYQNFGQWRKRFIVNLHGKVVQLAARMPELAAVAGWRYCVVCDKLKTPSKGGKPHNRD